MARRPGRPRTAKPLPTARSKRLGQELRLLREAAGLHQSEVAAVLGCATSKVSGIETGLRRVTNRELSLLLDRYGVPETHDRREALEQLARDADRPEWWDEFDPVQVDAPRLAGYLSTEDVASQLWEYAPLVVPGLLQTADYARAVARSSLRLVDNNAAERAETLVAMRLQRQEVLRRPHAPLRLWTVLDEAALRRPVGGTVTMAAQLRHLVEMSELANVTIQVLPFAVGAYPAMFGCFSLLLSDDPAERDMVWLESMAGDMTLDSAEHVRRFSLYFDHMRAQALSPGASLALIAEAAEACE